jgi:hypothetical protein
VVGAFGPHGVAARRGKIPRPTPKAVDEGRGRLGWLWSEVMGWVCWCIEEGVGAIRRISLRPNMACSYGLICLECCKISCAESGDLCALMAMEERQDLCRGTGLNSEDSATAATAYENSH